MYFLKTSRKILAQYMTKAMTASFDTLSIISNHLTHYNVFNWKRVVK
jgi:hypothetical protein